MRFSLATIAATALILSVSAAPAPQHTGGHSGGDHVHGHRNGHSGGSGNNGTKAVGSGHDSSGSRQDTHSRMGDVPGGGQNTAAASGIFPSGGAVPTGGSPGAGGGQLSGGFSGISIQPFSAQMTAAPTALPGSSNDVSSVPFGLPSLKRQLFDWLWKREDRDEDMSDGSDSKDADSSDSGEAMDGAFDSKDDKGYEDDNTSDSTDASDDSTDDASDPRDSADSSSGDKDKGDSSNDQSSSDDQDDADGDSSSDSGDDKDASDDDDAGSSEDNDSSSEDSSSGSGSGSSSNSNSNSGSGSGSSSTLPSGSGSSNSTTPSSGSSSSGNSTASSTFPAAAGESTLSKTMSVTGEFDGGMVRFGRGVSCTGQAEGGDSDAVFSIEDGGTLKNVIIGADQIEGVHCQGACTIENVWWEAVCEDALTFKKDGNGTVTGGGAKGAEDKVIQHNGLGTIKISGFSVTDFGKLYRSCGNCDTMGERHVVIDGVTAEGGTATFVGINSNYGDTATITNSCVTAKNICEEFEGNDTGAEPKEISSGPSSACIYTDADVSDC